MTIEGIVFKIVLLGEPAVGKTSLIRQYVEKTFTKDYVATLGVDFTTKEIVIPNISETPIKLTLWDIAGHTRFARYQRVFLAGTQGAILVFDLTRPPTLEALQIWIQNLQHYSLKTNMIILGNKNDLSPPKGFSPDIRLKQIMRDAGIDIYYSSSAKTGENVESGFHELATLIYKRLIKN